MRRFVARLLTFWLPIPKAERKALRYRINSWLVERGIGRGVKVGRCVRFYEKSHFTPGSEIGDWCEINGMKVAGLGKVRIGRHCAISWDVLAHTSNHDYAGDEIPFDGNTVVKDVEIGDFVWIGARVTLLPGTRIGEGAIIQGGSVVHGEIPPCSIAGGNPAKVFATRDAEKFARLKAEGRFFRHTTGWTWR